MSLKGMAYVVRQNTMTTFIDGYLQSADNRSKIKSYLQNLGTDTFDVESMLRHLGVDLDNHPDLKYSIHKVWGAKGGASANPYWPHIPVDERNEVTRQAFEAIVSLDRPTATFWLNIAEPEDTSLRARLSAILRVSNDVGFKFQITTSTPELAIVHLITPPPSKESNTPAGSLNGKQRSWVIGLSETIDRQAEALNEVHTLLHRMRRMNVGAQSEFAGDACGASGKVKIIQLRYHDPDKGGDIDFSNDPVA